MILVIAIILILILVLLCILVIPFNILLNLNLINYKIEGYFKLKWIVRIYQKKFPEEKEKKEKEKKKEQKFDIQRLPKIISLFYESLPYFIRILNSFLKSTNIENFNFKLILGLSSPYDTAILSGYLQAAFSIFNIIPQVYLQIEPDFSKEKIDAEINLNIKIRLFWIVIELIRAITKKSVRKLINETRKARG